MRLIFFLMSGMITILGPTACGKTRLAVNVASRLKGEIISADSRQVFKGMDIGTGKDLDDYTISGNHVPYHLIDIRDPGYEYNVFEFQNDFRKAYNSITLRQKLPILCGGTGLYIESVLRCYHLSDVPQNYELRKELENYSDDELTEKLKTYISLHNNTDTETRERLLRAKEIQDYQAKYPQSYVELPQIDSIVIGVSYPRDMVMDNIRRRLKQRLEGGMIDEVDSLLHSGVTAERLIRYGLEYKYLTLHAIGQLTFGEMFVQLETAIHQFAKRQMTWFRGMERRGFTIEWLDATLPTEEKVERIEQLLNTKTTYYGN